MSEEQISWGACSPGYQFSDVNVANGWRSPISLVLGELIEDGVIDFSSELWNFDSFNQEQRDRIYRKLEARFRYRSIGIIPFQRWRRRLLATMNEQMAKLKWAYQALEDGTDPMQAGSRYRKYRNIDSDFPQTLLSQNQDYASYGTDFEEEEIMQKAWLEFLAQLKDASGVDEILLDALEPLFSSLITVSMNGR